MQIFCNSIKVFPDTLEQFKTTKSTDPKLLNDNAFMKVFSVLYIQQR